MPFNIDTNFISMLGQNQLNESNKALSSSLEKLSQNKDINKYNDDISGLVISDNIENQFRGFAQNIQDLSDSISMTQLENIALEGSTAIINTIRNKALEATDANQSNESRAAVQKDIESALKSLNDIEQNTTYNGKNLLSDKYSNLADINVMTAKGAEKVLKLSDEALKTLKTSQLEIGTFQKQLNSTVSNLSDQGFNLFGSESILNNLDFSDESKVLSEMNILSDKNMLALAQGNIKYDNLSTLLQN